MNRLALVMVATLSVAPIAAQTAGSADPLESRVTIDYREAPASVVIGTLAATAGLKAEIGAGNLRPVTITLTNVKLGTALNAVCDNASCVWRLQGTLSVTPVPSDRIPSLPARVSFDIHDTTASDVFRALAAAINVPLTLDVTLSNGLFSLRFSDASTADVLNMLCNIYHCHWVFDPVRGLRVTP